MAVVSGRGGRAFSSGADLGRMHAPESQKRGWGPWRPDSWSWGRSPRTPLVAAIDGYALAGGLELALTCDIRIATPTSTFGAPEVRWALLHGLGALKLPAAVGMSAAMRMLLTGEFIDSAEALRIGLISAIVSVEELHAEADKIARQIAENDDRGTDDQRARVAVARRHGRGHALVSQLLCGPRERPTSTRGDRAVLRT